MIVVTADVGGSKTMVAVTRDGQRVATARGSGAPVRPGRALTTATATAELVRQALARIGLLEADALVIGAAGAGRDADADDLRLSIRPERLARRIVVVSDVMLAFAAMDLPVGILLSAGTGSVAVGRTPEGRLVRQGGHGWQMGDEGSSYWIGRRALEAIAAAEDGRAPATALRDAVLATLGSPTLRDLVGWSTIATPREVAALSRTVVKTADAGDATAAGILTAAADQLSTLVNHLAREFPAGSAPVPAGMAGGLLAANGPLWSAVLSRLDTSIAPLPEPVDPLLGGPLLLATKET